MNASGITYMNSKSRSRIGYLRRIETFCNPLADIIEEEDSGSEDSDSNKLQVTITKMASAQEVENLLKKYNSSRTKFNALDPTSFGGTVNDNAKDWLRKFTNYVTLNKSEEPEILIMFETLLVKAAHCWFDSLDEQYKKTWDDLQKKFKEAYFNNNT